ncbi:MAG TPA: argininosuccinate lyase [Candidatus Limnocylindrales bacterium]|jgi:argininosuccinate lyase|nr:argininosuccinate lyase [Candidatus Limnocylindrales bacterium]
MDGDEEEDMRLWGGRFADATDPRAADFSRSIDVDGELAEDDIRGSIAHVRGLGRARLLSPDEVDRLVAGLEGLAAEVQKGTLTWDPALEDVHLNLEAALGDRIGPLAGKLHTGRSRNDQVATDLRLWLRRAIDRLDAGIVGLERALVGLAERDGEAIFPGSTHIQPAQPVLLAHHLLAYVEMLERDRGRLADARHRANVSPLGAGAIAGAGYALDREGVAKELGFDGVTENSIDAVSDRDFVVEALAAVALAMVHLSRFAEEITWWSNPRFGFVRVADEFSTGSSMMPNKRNPDAAELVRGKSARAIAALTAMLGLLKGLPLGYQRDLQEDKPPLFGAVGSLEASLGVMTGLVDTLSVDRDRMRAAAEEGHMTATAVADALVRLGVPFRTAHHVVGTLVAEADATGLQLGELDASVVHRALEAADDEAAHRLARDTKTLAALRAAASIEGALAATDVIGGTAPKRVRAALRTARKRLDAESRAR